jgi:hypothetical protein
LNELLTLLATYVSALERGTADATPKERAEYQRRAEPAAAIGAALRAAEPSELKRLLDQEERALGSGFLLGPHGAAAEAALSKLIYRARMSGGTFAA